MRETEMREVLRELCDELDRRETRRWRGSSLGLAAALGLAALTWSGCTDAPPAATDAGVNRQARSGNDGSSVDIPAAVAVYSSPGCSFIPAWRR